MQMSMTEEKERQASFMLTDGVFGVYGEVGGLGVAPFGEGGGAVGGRALVGGSEGREEEEDEEERGSHGSQVWCSSVCVSEVKWWSV
jgi:hypothetical protein